MIEFSRNYPDCTRMPSSSSIAFLVSRIRPAGDENHHLIKGAVATFLLTLSITVFCSALQAASAPPEFYQGPDTTSVQHKNTMPTANPWIANALQDETFVIRHHIPYSRVELSQTDEQNQVGVGIELTDSERSVNFGDLNWRRHPSGHYTAVMAYTAERATALRIALNLADFPEKLTVKFINADKTKPYPEASLDYVKASEYLNQGATVHWSPIYPGDTLYIELNYPDATEAGFDARHIELPGISYLFADGPWGQKRSSRYKARHRMDYTRSGGQFAKSIVKARCGAIDVSCDTPGLPDTLKERFSRATGFLTYTRDRGGIYLCTGHLIKDKNSSSQKPYMLTANHCISSQNEAASLIVYWDYRSNSCGGNQSYSSLPRTRGGRLLETRPQQDWSFIELSSTPPGNRYFLDWDPAEPEVGETLYHIGHSVGHPQSYARGQIDKINQSILRRPKMMRVKWSDGVISGGVSGSILVKVENGNLYARSGGVSAGISRGSVESCNSRTYTDLLGVAPFSQVYSHISKYIDVNRSPVAEQDEIPCTYTLSETSGNLSAANISGGQPLQIEVNVITRPGCSWNAGSDSSFLSVNRSNGTGNGLITIMVRENTGLNSRNGRVTIAGETFTVTQDGKRSIADDDIRLRIRVFLNGALQ